MGIRGGTLQLAAGAMLAMGLATGEVTAAAPSADKLAKRFEQMLAASDRDDCRAVIRLGEAVLREGRNALTAEARAHATAFVAQCAYEQGDKAKSYSHAIVGSRLEESPDSLWHLRFWLELDAKRYEAAVLTVEEMSQGRGAALNSLEMSWLWNLNKALEDGRQTPLRRGLLKVLGSGAYAPAESGGDAQGLQHAYARLLAEDGDLPAARAVLAGLKDAGLLTSALLHPRLRTLFPADFDLRAAAEAALAYDRELAARNPALIDPILEVAADLRQLGRPQEALAFLLEHSEKVEDPEAYTDRSEKLPWYWDALARTYVALGRYDDAVTAFRKGASMNEGGGANVSQVINLAHVQVRFGRPEDALKTLAVFEDPNRGLSPYGQLAMRLARGCAYALLGNRQAAEADLAFALKHETDAPGAVGNLYLCLGRIDEAAASLIRRLNDPEQASDALQEVSEFDPRPVAIPLDPYEKRRPELLGRTDVQDAIRRAGGARRIPLQLDDI